MVLRSPPPCKDQLRQILGEDACLYKDTLAELERSAEPLLFWLTASSSGCPAAQNSQRSRTPPQIMSQFALFCVERECSTQRSQNSGQHGARPSCKSVSGPKPTPMCSVRTTPGTGVAPKLDLDFFAPTFLALSRCFRCHLQELLLNPPPPRSAPGAQWHKQAPRNMTWTRLPAGTAVLTH